MSDNKDSFEAIFGFRPDMFGSRKDAESGSEYREGDFRSRKREDSEDAERCYYSFTTASDFVNRMRENMREGMRDQQESEDDKRSQTVRTSLEDLLNHVRDQFDPPREEPDFISDVRESVSDVRDSVKDIFARGRDRATLFCENLQFIHPESNRTEDKLEVFFELPGLAKKTLDISVNPSDEERYVDLVVTGELYNGHIRKYKARLVKDALELRSASTKYEDGLLTVTFPVKEVAWEGFDIPLSWER